MAESKGRRSIVVPAVIAVLVTVGLVSAFVVGRPYLKAKFGDGVGEAHEAPVIAPTDPQVFTEFGQVKKRLTELEDSVGQLSPRLDQLSGDVAALNDSIRTLQSGMETLIKRIPEKTAASTAAAPSQGAPRRVVRKVVRKKPVAASKTTNLPVLVAVDTWGSTSSATIRQSDGTLKFVTVGDTVGVARVKSVDPRGQRVQVSLPNGSEATLKVR
ncbi:hypothetical protein [Nitrogeniibacter aestuarii]|uniref:hypothetical protein n=1 Tax=Nitrogeniibacter aestuarii TaxID=2815343 RepID=UPI001E4457C5|nr:hypothetical protein [Nitrogeniibacter aestuarii]